MTFSGTYGSNRHSGLVQIDSHNVNTLTMRWMHQLVGGHDKIESSPIVRDGVMYFSVPPGRVLAVDAATAKVFADVEPTLPGYQTWRIAVDEDRLE